MCSQGPGTSEVIPAYIYESNVHQTNVLTTLNEQRKCGLLCDISIIVQDTEFKAHKAILASCSTYFNRIITDPDNVSHNIVLELSSISKVGMECLLEFAYTSKLAVTSANVDDVLTAAAELEFKNIEFSCLNYLKQQLNSDKMGQSMVPASQTVTACSRSTISRKSDSFTKSAKSGDCPMSKIASKLEKTFGNSCKTSEPPKVAREPVKKDPSVKEICQGFEYADQKSEMCEQMSQEQHQAIIRKILEKHGLEPATVDDKSMEVGATETAVAFPERCTLRAKYPSLGGEKKMCGGGGHLSPVYNSDTDETGSFEDDMDSSPCQVTSSCGKLRKQPAIKLPFTMDEITSMPRSELHEMLTRDPNLTQEQICAIHEIRRRGKNRIAAQRCRKRKMECIRTLVAEIEMLRAEHAVLMNERRNARDQAIKLSDKFRAKCEKFFKCDKKKCIKKFCSASNSASAPTEEIPNPAEHFQEQARRAEELCERLKEVPTEDLPSCIPSGVPECSTWSNPCLSPSGAEGASNCSVDESDPCASGDQPQPQNAVCISPNSYAMSPSQGLSDFRNIHISPPSSAGVPSGPCNPRNSVVHHTNSVDDQRVFAQALPTLNPNCPRRTAELAEMMDTTASHGAGDEKVKSHSAKVSYRQIHP